MLKQKEDVVVINQQTRCVNVGKVGWLVVIVVVGGVINRRDMERDADGDGRHLARTGESGISSLYSVSSLFHSSSPVVHPESGLSDSNSSIGSCISTTAIQDLVRTACPLF